MPSDRAARSDFLAAEHIRKLMSITDEIDELIPCGWLSKEEAAQRPGSNADQERTMHETSSSRIVSAEVSASLAESVGELRLG